MKIITTQTGFTLMELLVVITLLGILAGAAIMAYEGVQEQGRDDVTRFQMAELRQALLRFRSDSGSRDFLGQGVYACDGEVLTHAKDEDSANGPSENWPDGAPSANSDEADWITWCQHPANFWMLFVDPLGDGWDYDRKRGWHGPYLQRLDLPGDVDAGFTRDGAGSGTSGSVTTGVWLIRDAYRHGTVGGHPYLMFDLDDADANNPARLVSLGDDGVYDGSDTSDCASPSNSLDHVLCLRR